MHAFVGENVDYPLSDLHPITCGGIDASMRPLLSACCARFVPATTTTARIRGQARKYDLKGKSPLHQRDIAL